jgi:glycosyltransferase involved in cell wall biosynthesis
MHFKIITPLYNAEAWITACLRSVKVQDYENFQCIVLDDLSTDNSAKIIKKEIEGDERFVFVENKEKALALKNIYDGIELSNPAPEDIIVTLDGDDWLANKQVLSKLKQVYEETNCLITYGSYAEYPSGQRGKFAKQISDQIIANKAFRQAPWCSSHLRTFKYKLWSKIKKEDLQEEDGRFCDGAWDLAFMFPMLEMAGTRSFYIKEILHIYNRANPLNEDKVDHRKLLDSEMRIRHMKKYNLLEEI